MASAMLRRGCPHTCGGLLGGHRLAVTSGRHIASASASTALARQPFLPRRSFATTVFNVRPKEGEVGAEQTLFVVGLNEGKFFGQDGAEEALKLLERIAEHGPQGSEYNLLLGLSDRDLAQLEADHKVKNQRLTPSRELEGRFFGEFVPILQASMVDRRPRRALGRLLKISQGHVSWQLWRHPAEAVKLYAAWWKRKEYKDAAMRKFWMERLPICAYSYFMEISHLVAARATGLMVSAYGQEKASTWVLLVSNQFFEPTVERLTELLDSSATTKFRSDDFARHLREQASELCVDAPDYTPLLLFIYVGVPILAIQFMLLAAQRGWRRLGVKDALLPPELRD